MDRRKFVSLGSAALVGLSLKSDSKIEGSFVNESFAIGHLCVTAPLFPHQSA